MKRLIIALFAFVATVTAAFADNDATFPGGKEAMDEYITSNLKYPVTAKENGIEGVVNVSFVVNADGSIGTIEIKRLIDPDLEQEAIRLVKTMPKWTPAVKDGKPVQSIVEMPILFTLPAE